VDNELEQARSRAEAAIGEFEAAMRDVAALIASTPVPALDPAGLAEVAAINGRAAGLMTGYLRGRTAMSEPDRGKWRHDVPVGRNVQTVRDFDPGLLRGCRVVITLPPEDGKLTVIAAEVPALTLRLPAAADPDHVAALVHALIQNFAAACDRAAVAESGGAGRPDMERPNE
jgi:hypothetical protein